MAEIVNLRVARRAKARKEKEAGAAVNRAKFGEASATKKLCQTQELLAARRLDGSKIGHAPPLKPQGSA